MCDMSVTIDGEFLYLKSEIQLGSKATIAELDKQWDMDSGLSSEEYDEMAHRGIEIHIDTPVIKAWTTRTLGTAYNVATWRK